uniref:Myb/SANT-like domain-containing protein n=1 Tax=Hordeum vulgare subsp. vulgare TaxID=112509 RepID=A0A8I6YW56_HORVV
MMTARGSPRLNLLKEVAERHRSSPPTGGVEKRRRGSPKEDRAQWNASLEKDLVDLLREHATPEHRGQNGWSSEAWNKIVKKFHQKNPYARYEKKKIQEKEKELKTDYRMIKEIRKQSGVSWDDQQCKILADPPLWKNIIISHPKAGKFKTKGFPLFDALGELHDGQTAEGTYNFTSIESSQYSTQAQLENLGGAGEYLRENHGETSYHGDNIGGEPSANGENLGGERVRIDEDVEEVFVQENIAVEPHQTQPSLATTPSRNGQEKEPKRRRGANSNVAAMMEKYLEIRAKQVEDERNKPRVVDEYSIKNCIDLLKTMDITPEEEVKAFRVFKILENREIFMSARPETALMWLRTEME